MDTRSVPAFFVLALFAAAGCSRAAGPTDPGVDASAPVAAGSTTLERLRAGYVPRAEGEPRRYPFAPFGIEATFERTGGVIAVRGTKAGVALTLPSAADKPFVLSSRGSRLGVRALDAQPVAARIDKDALVYEGARLGGTLVHVPLEEGTEELIELRARPAVRALRYQITLEKIAGLRLVEGRVLEALGADGDPLFRTSAPRLLDATGRPRDGTLRVEGCAFDASPAAPWGRPVTAPGAASCVVVGEFDDEGLTYPVLVDPAWTTTGSLTTKRYDHRAVAFSTAAGSCLGGCALVAGGFDGTSILATSELYNATAGTWSATGSLPSARRQHVMMAYTGAASAIKVLSAGGLTAAATATAAAETYDAGTGLWTATATSLSAARFDAAIVQNSSWIYVLGGSSSTGLPSAVVDRFGLVSAVTPAFQVATAMPGAATQAGAFGVSNAIPSVQRLVVVGGRATGTTAAPGPAQKSIYYADNPAVATASSLVWTTAATPLTTARYDFGLASAQGSGIFWFVAGGNPSTNVIERIDPVTLAVTTSTQTLFQATWGARGATVNTVSPSTALFVGGAQSEQVTILNFQGTGGSGGQRIGKGREKHQLVALKSGAVLAVGGLYGFMILNSAELFSPMVKGNACSIGPDCTSFSCTDGYCCDAPCTGQCQACNLPSLIGTCTTLTTTNGPGGYPAGKPVDGFGTTRANCTGFGTTCGAKCDGASATSCDPTPDGTTCSAASCTGGVETKIATCLVGSCPAAVTNNCEPYACDTTACRTTCADNTHCAPGYKCSGTTCVPAGTAGSVCATTTDCTPGLSCVDKTCCTAASCSAGLHCDVVGAKGTCKLPYGAACTAITASQCALGFCADGVCCDAACGGQCEACDVSGSAGKCIAVSGQPHNTRTKCVGTGACQAVCNGSDRTKCDPPPSVSTVCVAQSCSGTTYTPTRYCDGAGVCVTVSTVGCGAYTCDVGGTCKVGCTTTGDCASGYFCTGGLCKTTGTAGSACIDAGECSSGYCVDGVCCTTSACTAPTVCSASGKGTCSRPLSATCTADSECGSAHCVDGVCCNTTCTGQCEACDVSGSLGTCSPVAGKPHAARTACSGTGVCQAACDGADRVKCSAPPGTSTTCAAPSCTAGIATPPSYCDGAGNCKPATTKACSPYLCDTTDCKATCTADTDCASGYRCFGNACVPKAGVPCKTAGDCATGYCADGVCCDGACTGQCEACDVPGNEGKCAATNGKPRGSRPACFDGGGDVCLAGACNGDKDRTKCVGFAAGIETTCGKAKCDAAGKLVDASRCDGAGTCKASTKLTACDPYVCADGACKTSCTATTDCQPGYLCDKGACKPAPKSTCSADGLSSQPLDGGAAKPCGVYRCNPATGDCYDKCTTTDQCSPGSVCDAGVCAPIPPAADTGDSGGCAASPHGQGGSLAAFALLALVGVSRARKQRRWQR